MSRLRFVETHVPEVLYVSHGKQPLGMVVYDPEWKCYVWLQHEDVQMSSGCLQELVDKLKELDGGSLK